MSIPFSQDEFFGTDEFINATDFVRLVSRVTLNLGIASAVIWLIYYKLYKNREFVFTYYIFNFITFAMCVLLRKVPTELGFALGLFAVFGILRYRTEEIRMRDLTYMFIMIGIGIINGVANKKVSTSELFLVNGLIAGLTAVLELPRASQSRGSAPMLYDNLDLLKPENRELMIADLARRTGLEVVRVQVHRYDMLRDAAEITIFYRGGVAQLHAEESKRNAA
jgi:hypothetical protein